MHEIKLPQLGQSVEEAEIVTWLKQEGDAIAEGEPIFTVQTDKAEIEVESPAAGILRKILVQPGVEVPVLTVVALAGNADEPLPDLAAYALSGAAAVSAAPVPQAASAPATTKAAPAAAPVAIAVPSSSAAVSPRARKLAADHHVDATRLSGSGVGGRVMDADVRAFLDQLDETRISPTARRLAAGAGLDVRGLQGSGVGGRIMKEDIETVLAAGTPSAAPALADQRVPLTPMRRIIAERMGASMFNAPHYYVTVEVDMAAAKAYRAGLSYKVSYNDLVLRSVALTLREFPAVNARWAGDAIELVGAVNLGMAVALPTGLIVPVIRNADTLSLEALGNAARTLAEKAQKGKLLPDDYTGNTFTVSNLGAFGVDHFTAIINQPDSAIIAVGQMKDRVVAIDGGIHIRPIMKLTISSDHRVIDGALAAQFMGRLRERMETAAF